MDIKTNVRSANSPYRITVTKEEVRLKIPSSATSEDTMKAQKIAQSVWEVASHLADYTLRGDFFFDYDNIVLLSGKKGKTTHGHRKVVVDLQTFEVSDEGYTTPKSK